MNRHLKKTSLALLALLALTSFAHAQNASFTASEANGCSPLIVFFDASSSTGTAPLTYHWNFGNGNQSITSDARPGASYLIPGSYSVSLQVEDANGNMSSTASQSIEVFSGPQVSFALGAVNQGCSPLTVEFLDTSIAGSAAIAEYFWAFGDGTSSFEQNPVKTYNQEGIYDVKLILKDVNGCQGDFSIQNAVTVANPPEVDFEADITSTCNNNLLVQFTDRSSLSSLIGYSYTYNWNFGDGTTSTVPNPTKNYTAAGEYTVSLVITLNEFGCSDTLTVDNMISIGGPQADFDFDILESCNQNEVTFNLTTPVLPSYKINWVLDDGTILSGASSDNGLLNFTHNYAATGDYNVSLIVEDTTATACFKEVVKAVSVQQNLFSIDFTTDQNTSCTGPLDVQFTYVGDPAVDFVWDFGDGTTSTDTNPSHTYTADGNYTITLTVTDANGCEHNLIKDGNVRLGNIIPLFNSNGKEIVLFPEYFEGDEELILGGCSDTPVNFIDASISPTQIISWTWDFGDGTPPITTTNGAVDHLYAEGIYSPSLTIETIDGCRATYQCNECVKRGDRPEAQVNVIADSLSCCGYNGFFDNQTDTTSIDFIWYTVPTGDFWPFEKNDTTGGFPNDGDWDFGTLVPVPKCGATTDMAIYTYNKGCADSVQVLDWQRGIPPLATGEPEVLDVCVSNWYPGMVLDLNDTILFDLNWNRFGDGTVDEVTITWNVDGVGNTQCGFSIDTTYRVEDHGYWIEEENCANPPELVMKKTLIADSMRFYRKFPVITIPDCFQPNTATDDGYWFSIKVKDETSPAMCSCTTAGERFFVTVFEPSAEITPSVREGCAPLDVDLMSNVTGNYNNIRWTLFSDTDTLTFEGDNPSVTLDNPGTYRYSVELITDACSYDSVYMDSIRVNSVEADFTIDPSYLCFDNDIDLQQATFIDSTISAVGIVNRSWTFGNGNSQTGNDSIVTHQYAPGDVPPAVLQKFGLQASLEVEDNLGCKDVHTETIFLVKPEPSFTTEVEPGCENELIFRVNEASGIGPLAGRYNIRLIDGNDTTNVKKVNFQDSEVARTFVDNGDYLINLEITRDSLGSCFAMTPDTLISINTPGLTPGFFPNETVFSCPPAAVIFTDTSRHDLGLDIVAWKWEFIHSEFGKVSESEVQNPTEIFLNSGYISVKLSIKDIQDCEKSIFIDSLIYLDGLTGQINLPSDSVCIGSPATFIASSPNADRITWDFGDGVLAQGDTVTHTYTQTGVRFPSIILEDNSGLCNVAISDTIYIVGPPLLDLGPDLAICEGDTINITSGFTNRYDHLWNDGSTSNTLQVSDAGNFWLTVTDTLVACQVTDSIVVIKNPIPDININETPTVCEGEQLNLSAEASENVRSFKWYINDVLESEEPSFVFTLNSESPVRLVVEDNNGCINEANEILKAVEIPVLDLKDLALCPGDSIEISGEPTNRVYEQNSYQWYRNGQLIKESESGNIVLKEEGEYQLEYSTGACRESDSLMVVINPIPDVTTNDELVVFCSEDGDVELSAGNVFNVEWLESGITDTKSITVDEAGTYYLMVTNEFGCPALDSILVEDRCGPRVFIPDAFSPNNDGDNETFDIFTFNLGSYELFIYNRWGEVIFHTTDNEEFWDGEYRGDIMPSGVYPWMIRYKGDNVDHDELNTLNGKVTLIR